jgi:magnesium transporter
MVHEILSEYGKMILNYREGIEDFAIHLDEQSKSLSPKKLLTAKSQLSDFSRVLERLFYTLSFPPTRGLLDEKSSYRESFDYLLKITTLLTSSIQQTEDRLESLNDHYQLLLQNRANKRLNLLTIVQAIFVPLTLVVGVYGMNFKYMPELEYHYGYFVSLILMALFILLSIYYFYSKGWFRE